MLTTEQQAELDVIVTSLTLTDAALWPKNIEGTLDKWKLIY